MEQAQITVPDISTAGWVADLADPVCWENGLKWLSKAIVSDNDPFDKKELKGQLEKHIEVALRSSEQEIRTIGFFYVLAWKRLDLVAGYAGSDGRALLQAGLERVYEKLEFTYLSLRNLVTHDWAASLASVAALLYKKVEPLDLPALAEGLSSSDEAKVSRTLRIIDEYVRVLGIPEGEYQPILADFWRKRRTLTGNFISIGDIRRARQYFAMVEPVRQLFQAIGADHCSLLLDYLDLARGEDFFAGLIWSLRWGCREAIDIAIDRLWPSQPSALARLVRVHADCEVLNQERCQQLVVLAGASREAVHELLELCIDPAASAPVFALAIDDGLADSSRRESVFVLAGAMIDGLKIKSPEIISSRARFLTRVWDLVESSSDPAIWEGALALLSRLVEVSQDALLDGEFFLPLLRECLLAKDIHIARVALGYVRKRSDLARVVQSWLSEPQVQNELVSGLSSLKVNDQVQALNRLTTLYCRYPVASAYLSKRINRYLEQLAKAGVPGDLKQRMQHAAERINLCVVDGV